MRTFLKMFIVVCAAAMFGTTIAVLLSERVQDQMADVGSAAMETLQSPAVGLDAGAEDDQ